MAVNNLNLNFNLRNPKCPGTTPINLVIRYNNQRLVYPSGENINPKNWQGDKTKKGYQRAIAIKLYEELNFNLDQIENSALDIFRKYKNDNNHSVPSPKIFKQLLDIELKRTDAPIKSLIPFVKKFIEESKTRKNQRTGKTLSTRTIKKYETTLKHLQKFISKKYRIDFEDITLSFRNDYMAFLDKEYNLAVNSIGKDITVIKTFLNAAAEAGINNNQQFKSSKFTSISEKSDSIYLTEQELALLYSLDLSNNKTLESVRDLFLIGCWTGLRYSDYSVLNGNNIIDDLIKVETYKTGETVYIPFHPVVKAIFEKYNHNLPRCFSNQKTNQYLKDIGQKIDALKISIEKKITKGGVLVKTKLPKYKLITTHTARRSFATNLFLGGFPAIKIMKITGHRTESAFMRYIKMTSTETANSLASFWGNKYSQTDSANKQNNDSGVSTSYLQAV